MMSPHNVEREMGSLALGCVQHDNGMLLLRAAQWRNALRRVGVTAPFWLIHDCGALFVLEPSGLVIGTPPQLPALGLPPTLVSAYETYVELIAEVSRSDVVEQGRKARLDDALVTVVLLRVLGGLSEPGSAGADSDALPLDAGVLGTLWRRSSALFTAHDRAEELRFLQRLGRERLRLLTSIEQVDLETLRLVGMFGSEAAAVSAMDVVDVLHAVRSPEASDIAQFSLDLLPNVLETTKATGEQMFSFDGYASIAHRGSLDSMVFSELAFDTDLFEQRFAENEVLYYAHEKQHTEERRLHYIAIDASASMRGQRSVFARGLAIALTKKLLLRGEHVYLRFFDSRLYDVQHARPGARGTAGLNIAYLLSFRSERGRHYAKVFGMLERELRTIARRERSSPTLYILTHAECHVPVSIVEQLGAVARLYGIFMLPSSATLELEYLDHLDVVQIVDHVSQEGREERRQRALEIVEDAAAKTRSTQRVH